MYSAGSDDASFWNQYIANPLPSHNNVSGSVDAMSMATPNESPLSKPTEAPLPTADQDNTGQPQEIEGSHDLHQPVEPSWRTAMATGPMSYSDPQSVEPPHFTANSHYRPYATHSPYSQIPSYPPSCYTTPYSQTYGHPQYVNPSALVGGAAAHLPARYPSLPVAPAAEGGMMFIHDTQGSNPAFFQSPVEMSSHHHCNGCHHHPFSHPAHPQGHPPHPHSSHLLATDPHHMNRSFQESMAPGQPVSNAHLRFRSAPYNPATTPTEDSYLSDNSGNRLEYSKVMHIPAEAPDRLEYQSVVNSAAQAYIYPKEGSPPSEDLAPQPVLSNLKDDTAKGPKNMTTPIPVGAQPMRPILKSLPVKNSLQGQPRHDSLQLNHPAKHFAANMPSRPPKREGMPISVTPPSSKIRRDMHKSAEPIPRPSANGHSQSPSILPDLSAFGSPDDSGLTKPPNKMFKRHQVARACDHCRKSRRKCCENLPCTRCVTKGLICTITSPPPSVRRSSHPSLPQPMPANSTLPRVSPESTRP
ncbi:uncharacterized protein BJ171DRAFT_470907 [Polychytrium aggregatum]|uniref:uncharacterized protein n=1 Tax=Polychytrium aggregatum TaxID=110093 RepID=UPI0022FEF464|nr:uncharacterized protein BJ171DRAFT_470907 [Polychytrium aggregatum]KAI9209227.1 hypothetical protein BJ171DRAFT_470907 [Polychytrium aggregatum]